MSVLANSPIPADRQPAVARALAATFATTEPDAVAQLSGGLSGARIYRIRVGGVAYLLRLEGARDIVRDPARWYGCMRTAADAFLSPTVRYADSDEGVAIMDFIVERSLVLDYAGSKAELLTELGHTLRALHQTSPFPPLMPYLDALEGLVAQFCGSGLLPPQALAPVLGGYRAVAGVYRGLPADPVSSHNDLNPRNVLYDGRRLWLVDWESAFLADRYVDLAAAANFFASGPDEVAGLLRAYFGQEPDEARQARLYLARQISHVFYAVTFLSGVAAERPGLRLDGPPPATPSLAQLHAGMTSGDFVLDAWEGRLTYGLACLETAAANMASPDCADAVRRLAA
jgi:hypothetical protein